MTRPSRRTAGGIAAGWDGAPRGPFVGIDVGGTNIKWSLVIGDGAVADSGERKTEAAQGPDTVMARVEAIAREAAERSGPLVGVGLALPGRVDRSTGTTVSMSRALPGPWEGMPVFSRLEASLQTPVFLVNDGIAFALAEHALGAGRGSATMLGITLGTGVGGGIVIDGSLVLGADDSAGEIGHIPVAPDGLQCGCGNRGCVEAIASGTAIAKEFGEPVEIVATRAANGDLRAAGVLQNAARALGTACWAASAVVSPDTIVVGGGVGRLGGTFLEQVRQELHKRSRPLFRHQVTVVGACAVPNPCARPDLLLYARRSCSSVSSTSS